MSSSAPEPRGKGLPPMPDQVRLAAAGRPVDWRRIGFTLLGLGLFVMFLPPVGQMFIAAAAAIWLRVNLPISVSLVFSRS